MKRIMLSLAIALMLPAAPVAAQGFSQSLDAKQARQALENGDIIEFKVIRQKIQRKYGGKLIDLDLVRTRDNRMEYRIQWETKGERINLVVDARTGQIREV